MTQTGTYFVMSASSKPLIGLFVFYQETDYIMSYFDNGEEFGGDSDDNMDEATY